MRRFAALLASLVAFGVHAAQTPAPAGRTYALVAAFPDRFTVVVATKPGERAAGSSIRTDRYRRTFLEAPAGTFNGIALDGLEKVIAERDSEARFVRLAQPGDTPRDIAASDREAFLLERVASALAPEPARREWHRIVLALPAYRAMDVDGMPTRLEGFGLFMQPNCQGDPRSCAQALRPPSGPPTLGPDGQEVRASFFVAPYANVAIVILDPAKLAVLDRETRLDFQRYWDPLAGTMDLARNIPKEILAPKVVGLIARSLGGAIARTELAGKVGVGTVKEVKP